MTYGHDLKFLELWDAYSPLLTPTQRAISDLFFNYDLSISEIAAEKGITRQGVQECIKKCKAQLEEYEATLKFCEISRRNEEAARLMKEGVRAWAEKTFARAPAAADGKDELYEILQKDYTLEAAKALENKN